MPFLTGSARWSSICANSGANLPKCSLASIGVPSGSALTKISPIYSAQGSSMRSRAPISQFLNPSAPGCPINFPSPVSKVQAWKGQLIFLALPAQGSCSSTSFAPRWVHIFKKARALPSLPRATKIDGPAASNRIMSPAFGISPDNPATRG